MNPIEAKNHRRRLGLSQVKTARMAGVSRYRYIMWEFGNDPLRPDELRVIAELFHQLARDQIKQLAAIPHSAA
jgi:transcriptional regulator with XRE-family HTH domain